MLLTNYQITEILIGTFIFPMLYFLYLYFSESPIIYWDILWCTLTIGIVLLFRNFYMNYYILQSQNISSNIIVNGIY